MFNNKKKKQQRASMIESLIALGISIVWMIICFCTFGGVTYKKTNIYVLPSDPASPEN